jgi:hypothetical protein
VRFATTVFCPVSSDSALFVSRYCAIARSLSSTFACCFLISSDRNCRLFAVASVRRSKFCLTYSSTSVSAAFAANVGSAD